MSTIDIENTSINFWDLESMQGMDSLDPNMVMYPWMAEWFWILITIVYFIFIIIPYFTKAYWLYLLNKKLGEKHAWLSFVPILQIYNYFTASKKSALYYLVLPIIAMIIWFILTSFTSLKISMFISLIYFTIMWVKLLHAISKRTWRSWWTTLWFLLVGFVMFPAVWTEFKWQSQKTETKNEL